jgi:hypothetical protein
MLLKKNKDGNKYPGPDGNVCRWKRQVMRKLGSKKVHSHLLVNRLNQDLRNVKEFIVVKETPTEDKDKNKDKEKDTKKNYIYSKDVDTRRHRSGDTNEDDFRKHHGIGGVEIADQG